MPLIGDDEIILADGSSLLVEMYQGTVVWDGKPRNILVHRAKGDALIGMSLMYDYLLSMPIRENETVTLSPIS